ncbi:hypothetical protein Agub_g7654 [Astrephomene gubernaculifera]|uniref:Uncharacterized protein n=1 Tax=Astrephomene gubernaculifera TaxID=47775 RepID=A0AAD3DQS3_9CHLO|nr:hypothetical protein Agub_g7654 [Astrephomene gubernaculifera]
MAVANGSGVAEEVERPAKRSKTGRGRKAAAPPPPPTATQRLLPLIRAEMRDYQLKGVAWLISLYKNGVNGILADEMGLGKTLQTIGFISYLWTHCKDTSGKYMVVGPLSTLPNWVSEFNRFCPDIPVLLYHGTPQEREELRSTHMKQGGSQQMPVIVTSYEIVMADRRYLERHRWKLVAVDEGHRLKNFDCRLLRELRCLQMDSRLLLTGTPLQNNLKELWSLLSFCMPQIFADANQFLDWFDIRTPAAAIPATVTAPAAAGAADAGSADGQQAKPSAGKRRGRPSKKPSAASAGSRSDAGASGSDATESTGENKAAGAASMVSRLHAILKPFVLRRVKADVNIGVPPKQEVVLYADMTEEQRRLTRGLIDGTLKEELAKEAAVGARTGSLNNLIMQMRKVCNHPDLITGPASGCTAYPSADQLVEQCGKLALLDRLLKQLRKGGHRVLIFSQMTEMLNVLEAYLQDLGIQAMRIDGSVPWQQRKEGIAEFQSGQSDKWVFLLSTRAGGLGINLTAADTVIIYDSDWNPHQDSQAMDRCHRIGQTRPVLVFRLVTSNSVENRMLAKADSKKALERIVMKKGAFKELLQTTSSTSADELAQLLNPDRRSGDLAQSGVVSEEMLQKLLDRSHLAAAHEQQQKKLAQQAQAGSQQKGKEEEDKAGGESRGPPLPPYPLVGVGYEVVVDEPRRAVGLLQTIEVDQSTVEEEPPMVEEDQEKSA